MSRTIIKLLEELGMRSPERTAKDIVATLDGSTYSADGEWRKRAVNLIASTVKHERRQLLEIVARFIEEEASKPYARGPCWLAAEVRSLIAPEASS